MLSKTCRQSHHKDPQIRALCLEKKCRFNRLLCVTCMGQGHRKHDVTLVDTESNECKLHNLDQNYGEGKQKTNYAQLDSALKEFMKRPNRIYEKLQESRVRCYEGIFMKIEQTIRESFVGGKVIEAAHTILEEDPSDANFNKIEIIAEKIRNLDKPHVKDIPRLYQTLQVMASRLDAILEETENVVLSTLEKLEKQAKQWSIFNNKNWIQLQQQLDEEQETRKQQAKYKQNEQEKSLVKTARQLKWRPINEWIQHGKRLIDMDILVMNGKKEGGLISGLFGGGLKFIEGLDCLKNLKVLDLGCNHISAIENLGELEKLQELHLYSNNIRRIQNLDNLVNLTGLFLGSNKIEKIENLENLQSLKSLSLSNNKIRKVENLLGFRYLQEVWLYDNPLIKQNGKFRQQMVDNQGIIELLRQHNVKLRLTGSKN